jgi:hypothetical protein
VEGMSDKVKGKLKETESKLTDDELREKEGRAQNISGRTWAANWSRRTPSCACRSRRS